MSWRAAAVFVVGALVAVGCGTDESAPPLVTVPAEPTEADADPSSEDIEEAAGSSTDDQLVDIKPALIEQLDCPSFIAGENVACGIAEVALDPLLPDGATTTISLATVQGYDTSFATPMAVLQGGPGGASTDMAEWLPQQAYTQVFIDQRGTGFAESDFDCDEFDDAMGEILASASDEADRIATDSLNACADRLSSDPLFAHVTTANHAADVTAVMEGLGYERWVAYGVSYGSTIGFELLRQPSPSLVGVVLDGVYPPDIDVDEGVAFSAEVALDRVAVACASSAICSDYAPDVREALERVIADFDRDPATIELSGPESGVSGGVDVVIDGTRLADLVFILLYSERTVRYLPAVIGALDGGDNSVLGWLASIGSRTMVSSYAANDEATYFAVQCHDRLPFVSLRDGIIAPFADAVARTSLEAGCESWGQGEAYEIAGTAVESSLPTLLLSGEFDPITPAVYADSAAETLTESTVVTQAGRGHGIWVGDSCIASIVLAFVSDPQRELDVACADDGVPVEWARP